MQALMQDWPLLISSILQHGARHHGAARIASVIAPGVIHAYTCGELEARARRLARVLEKLGVRRGDRVATLAWNGYRHLEIYYASPGSGAICHTINPRLPIDEIAYMIGNAEDATLFVDLDLTPLVGQLAPKIDGIVKNVVILAERANMPDLPLPPGMRLHCYEDLMADADDDYAWPTFDEQSASSICYTSGTTGKPKGVVYSHRSTVLHAMALNTADGFALRAIDRVMPAVPMFHVNAWGIPYAAIMAGAALLLPGRFLDGESLYTLIDRERATFAAGVPTLWLALLQHLEKTGAKVDGLQRLIVGGSACPEVLWRTFTEKYGVCVDHAWGMTEISPLGSFNRPKTETPDMAQRLRQGRAFYGVDMKITDEAGAEVTWTGKDVGKLHVRGPWVCSAYIGDAAKGAAVDTEGWFDTGDIATIDADGFMHVADRAKDMIKSGGEWISSLALENIARSHPDVAEAAVIAAHHDKWQERPLLIVRTKSGAPIATQSLLGLYKDRVASWQTPDDVIIVADIPHTGTGKINKVALRQSYGNHLRERSA
jgi:acyl-CoA synthetase (AMP-forming)/AMP-acid ligase II